MKHEFVSSSQVESVAYKAETQTLQVQFKRGGLYEYYGVPQDVHAALMASDSLGKFVAQNIKSRYRFKRVE